MWFRPGGTLKKAIAVLPSRLSGRPRLPPLSGQTFFLRQFASPRQSLCRRFQPGTGSRIVEHPGGSEDGELSSAVLGPPGTSCRRTHLICGRNSPSWRVPAYGLLLFFV